MTAIPASPATGDTCSELRANSHHRTCRACGKPIHPSLNRIHFKWMPSRHPHAGGIDPTTGRNCPSHFWDVTHWTHLNCPDQ